MNVKQKVEELLKKPVKKRAEWEHHFLIRFKYGGSVRDYLLSMGRFKEEKSNERKDISPKRSS